MPTIQATATTIPEPALDELARLLHHHDRLRSMAINEQDEAVDLSQLLEALEDGKLADQAWTRACRFADGVARTLGLGKAYDVITMVRDARGWDAR